MSADDIFIGGLVGSGMLDDDRNMMINAFKSEAMKYFPNCPICGSGKIQVNIVVGGKDTLSCLNCGSRWHLYFSVMWGNLSWAKLELEADNGKGKELMNKEIQANEWLEMAKKSRRNLSKEK